MDEQAQGQAAASEATADTQVEAKPEASEAERTYTHSEYQAALNKVGSKEKKEGRTARDNELLEKWSEFGIESLDDVEAVLDAQRTIETELEGEQITDLKKQHKAQVKELGEERDRYRGALESLLEKEREGIPEHITEVLDEMPPDKQLVYIAKHREALKAKAPPPTVGRGSAPGSSGGNSGATEGVFGPSRIRVGYEKRNR